MEKIKILSIGNSFSQDGTRYLQEIDDSLFVRNLMIPGCSLERHAKNVRENLKAYVYEENAVACQPDKVSCRDILLSDKWDIVTIQQVSHLAGVPESYEPFLSEVINEIKSCRKTAKIYFQQTWAYDTDCTMPNFGLYNFNCEEMDKKIAETTGVISENYNIPLIKTGKFISRLRNIKGDIFNNTPFSLYRDSFHLSFDYGRFAAALAWDYYLTGKVSSVIPNGLDTDIAKRIIEEFKKEI